MNFSGIGAGLAAVYPGMIDTEARLTEQDRRALALKQAQTDQAGQEAWGNALRQIAQMAPGPPMAAGPSPQPPMPGQPSVPAAGPPAGSPAAYQGQPMQPGMSRMIPGMPAAPGSPPPAAPPGAGGAGGPALGPQPSPTGAGTPPFRQPQDWRQVVAAVAQANPGASPAVIAAAVDRAIPWMNAQSQSEWRQLSLMMREQQITSREQIALMLERGREGRSERTEEGRERRSERTAATAESRLNLARERFTWQQKKVADEFDRKMEQDRQRALRFDRTADAKQRAQAFNEWEKTARARHRAIAEAIMARRDLAGDERKAVLKELADETALELEQLENFRKQSAKGEQPGVPVSTDAGTLDPAIEAKIGEALKTVNPATGKNFTREEVLEYLKSKGLVQ